MTLIYDVIVLGGGIVGASAAYALSQRGQQVLLIDQYDACHTHGSSHGDGRIARFNYTEAIYVEMAQQVFPLWTTLSERFGQALIQQTGLIEYGLSSSPIIEASKALLTSHNVAFELMNGHDANARFQQFTFAGDSTILYQADGSIIFATKAVDALWRLVQENGGETRSYTRIAQIDVNTHQVILHSDAGETFVGRQAVIATGGWSEKLMHDCGVQLPLTVTQEVLAYFAPQGAVSHRVGDMPVLFEYHHDDIFYCLPMVDIGGVKVGWHHSGDVIQPDDVRQITPAIMDALYAWTARSFRHLHTTPLDTLTCLYTNTPDYHFIIDYHPAFENVVLATGFSGHGFKFGPLLGEMIADMLKQQPLGMDIDLFKLSRFDTPNQLHKLVGA